MIEPDLGLLNKEITMTNNSKDNLVKCGLCGYFMLPWQKCEDTDGCPHYRHP